MFSPSTVFNVGGLIDGVDITVTISASSPAVDASQHAHNHTRTIVDVHNIATMLVVAVNQIFRKLQEDALQLVVVPPQVPAAPSPRARLLEFQGRKDDDDDDTPPTVN